VSTAAFAQPASSTSNSWPLSEFFKFDLLSSPASKNLSHKAQQVPQPIHFDLSIDIFMLEIVNE